MNRIYEAFLKLADKKKELNDDDILMLAGADLSAKKHVRLEALEVTTGKGVVPDATIRLNVDGEEFSASSTGNGPLDASIKALKNHHAWPRSSGLCGSCRVDDGRLRY